MRETEQRTAGCHRTAGPYCRRRAGVKYPVATVIRCCRTALTPARAVRLVGLVLVLAGGCSSLRLASEWTPTSALAEGKSEAWAGLQGHYFSGQSIFAAASNDTEYLHLLVRFRTSDVEWVRACAMNGLTVWLDPSGKRKKTLGIRFAAGPTREDMAMPMMKQDRPGRTGIRGKAATTTGRSARGQDPEFFGHHSRRRVVRAESEIHQRVRNVHL